MSGVENVFSLVSGGFAGLTKLSGLSCLSKLAQPVAHSIPPTGRKILWTLLAAICLMLAVCSTSQAAITKTGSIQDGGSDTSTIYVGYSGVGTLGINAGSTLTRSSGYVGYDADSAGLATITGIGSKWINSGNLYVGHDWGDGTLSIQSGGYVSSATAYVGTGPRSIGTVAVSGIGTTWTNNNRLYVGVFDGNGTLNIEAGGQVNSKEGYVGCDLGSGKVSIKGSGSTWANSANFSVGGAASGSGTLNIESGGQVSNTDGFIGSCPGSIGLVTITGTTSKWTSRGNLHVGSDDGSGRLTMSDGGKITAMLVSVNSISSIRLNVGGNGMLMLGNATTVGSIANSGTVSCYATAFLASGTYTPIAEYAGRAMTWSGSGSYKAFGGVWNSTAKTFTVSSPTLLAAGESRIVSEGGRLIFADAATGRRVGASFYNGTVTGSPTFSAVPMSGGDIAALRATAGFEGTMLSAWAFDTTYTGNEVLLAFDIGTGMPNPTLWHYSGGVWSPFTADMFTYDANGIVSFNTTTFDGYAVVAVPEPATLALLAVSGLAILRRRRTR